MAQAKPPALKILMLHGYTNTGDIFHMKTSALEKHIKKSFPGSTLLYIDGPHRLRPSEIPSYPGLDRPDPRSLEPEHVEIDSFAWWRRRDPAPNDPGGLITYEGIEEGLGRIANAIREDGPFDGVIGFSQGACAAGIVTALLARGRREEMEKARIRDGRKMAFPRSFEGSVDGVVQGPLKFTVIYSGFCAPEGAYGAFYEPKLTTPTLHVIGTLDTIVSEERSLGLVNRCEDAKVISHPGGHFCPSTRPILDGIVSFIRDAVVGKQEGEGGSRGLGTGKVEDMEMPF